MHPKFPQRETLNIYKVQSCTPAFSTSTETRLLGLINLWESLCENRRNSDTGRDQTGREKNRSHGVAQRTGTRHKRRCSASSHLEEIINIRINKLETTQSQTDNRGTIESEKSVRIIRYICYTCRISNLDRLIEHPHVFPLAYKLDFSNDANTYIIQQRQTQYTYLSTKYLLCMKLYKSII